MTVRVAYMEYSAGIAVKIESPSMIDMICYPDGFREALPKGWHCQVYVRNENESIEFLEWLEKNFGNRAEETWRFNSGDPYHEVYIEDDDDAALFKLKWM